ncbi:MFS general substrate transporter, partial [Aureobasidium melanogenum]
MCRFNLVCSLCSISVSPLGRAYSRIVLLLDWVDARILYFHSSRPIFVPQNVSLNAHAGKPVSPAHMTWRHYPVQSVYPPPALTSTPVPRLTDRLLVVRQLLQAFQPLLRRYAHPWSPSQASRTLLVHGEPVWQWRLSFRWSERLDVTISKSRGDVLRRSDVEYPASFHTSWLNLLFHVLCHCNQVIDWSGEASQQFVPAHANTRNLLILPPPAIPDIRCVGMLGHDFKWLHSRKCPSIEDMVHHNNNNQVILHHKRTGNIAGRSQVRILHGRLAQLVAGSTPVLTIVFFCPVRGIRALSFVLPVATEEVFFGIYQYFSSLSLALCTDVSASRLGSNLGARDDFVSTSPRAKPQYLRLSVRQPFRKLLCHSRSAPTFFQHPSESETHRESNNLRPFAVVAGSRLQRVTYRMAEEDIKHSSPSNLSLDQGYSSGSEGQRTQEEDTKKSTIWRRIYNVITYTPPRCRWDPEKPPTFSMALNVLFGFAGAFTVANLYYSHPILNILADEFNVPYERASQIPTVMQAGYAAGLLFLCPLGDLLPRRPFVLLLVFFTATMWYVIGVCVTSNLAAFTAISFITAVTTVTPQLMLPLVGDLAPPSKRAASLSIVTSGLLLGMLIARLLSGVLTNFTSWRNIYWLALGLQYVIFILLWFFMPDYPSTNPNGINYFKILWSILEMLFKEPVLVQACFITFFTAATFTCFWTTLTFLLAGAPYHYDSLTIGLFALIGIASMCIGPFWAKYVIDRFVPLFSVILGECWCMLGICIGTYTGRITIAGPVIQAFFNDFGLQTAQIANRSAIYSIAPKARNRVNTAFMVATFCGQLVGTAAGNHLYARGGWVVSGSYSVASIGAALICCFARGPWAKGWFGWGGGWSIYKKSAQSADGKAEEKQTMGAVEADGTIVRDPERGEKQQERVNEGHVLEKGIEMLGAEDGENPVREMKDHEEDGENRTISQDEDLILPVKDTQREAAVGFGLRKYRCAGGIHNRHLHRRIEIMMMYLASLQILQRRFL